MLKLWKEDSVQAFGTQKPSFKINGKLCGAEKIPSEHNFAARPYINFFL
jgi:hypothetical protein